MPKYTYTGEFPRVLTGLIQGVNAHHYPADGSTTAIPDGATVEVRTGDSVDTGDLVYPAHQIEDVATGAVSVTPDEAPEIETPAPAPAAADPAPAPAPDPAPATTDAVPAPTF